jgi:hypothetical protein
LERETTSLERLHVLDALSNNPISEINRMSLVNAGTVKSFIQMMASRDTKRQPGAKPEKLRSGKLPVPVWSPWLASVRFEGSVFEMKTTEKGKSNP